MATTKEELKQAHRQVYHEINEVLISDYSFYILQSESENQLSEMEENAQYFKYPDLA